MDKNSSPVFLLGVGAQKCGTSWLAEQLKLHPQFMMSPIKEIHYWDRRFYPEFFGSQNLAAKLNRTAWKTPEALLDGPDLEHFLMGRHELYYKTFFQTRLTSEHTAFGEFSPSYCILSESEYSYIRDFMAPYRTRALFMMRDPVARLWSQCKMEAQKAQNRGMRFDPYNAFEKRADKPAFQRRGDYKATIQNLDRAFPESERLYIFFEELFQPESLRRICNFAEVAMFDFDTSANPNEGMSFDRPDPAVWAGIKESYAPIYDFVEQRMGYLPEKWRV